MKKMYILMILLVGLTNSAFAINYCECGLYAGAQAGWAIIKSPEKNDLEDKHFQIVIPDEDGVEIIDVETFRKDSITDCRGSFAWGINGGYNYPICPNLLVGCEAGYHDNGSSSLTFSNGNEYKIESTDWEVLGTGTYIWCPGLWLNIKWGAARVRQVYRIWHLSVQDIDPTGVNKTWVPTTTIGLGYNFCNFDLYVSYRYVFGRDQSKMSDTFKVRGEEETFPGTLQMKHNTASVHAFYIGLQASIY